MAHPHTAGGADPRKFITPESFSVAPHLLGLPLASPTRRLLAILLDLVLVAIVSHLGGKVLFALVVGASFFWFAGRKLGMGGTFFSRTSKAALRGFGALMLFIAAASLWNSARDRVEKTVGDDEDAPAAVSAAAAGPGKPSAMTALRMAGQLLAVQNAPDSAHAFTAAHAAVRQMRRLGMSDAEIRESLSSAADDADEKPFAAAAFRAAMPAAGADSAKRDSAATPPDSVAALYVAAVHGGDSARADALRPKLASVLARDSLDALRDRVGDLEKEQRELKHAADQEEKKGLLGTLLGLLDDLGIGFGWTGLYFTAFTALWKGQTPGKKLFGIRVLRLDGLPMTLWASFERFGGYAAGLFTGLSGYAQVYWDRNRQAIQDKISETVVIRAVPGSPVPVAPPPRYPLPPRPAPAFPPMPAAGPGEPPPYPRG